MKFFLFKIFFLTLFLAAAHSALGQQQNTPGTQGGDPFIHIRFSDEFSYKIVGLDTLKKLVGNVELYQDSVFLFCDSALIVNSSAVTATGNFILQHGESTTIFADSGEYRSDIKIAELFSNVSLLNGQQKLFTEKMSYNANTKIATYLTGATLTNDTTFLTSVRGYFNTETNDIFFKDNVVIVNPDFTLRTDTLKYQASSEVATFLAPTLIAQDSARIYTEAGFYNIKEKQASFTKNPQYLKGDRKAWAKVMRYDGSLKEVTLISEAYIEDSTSLAIAELIVHSELTEVTVLEGNAFIRDGDRTIRGDRIIYDARNGTYSTIGRTHIEDGSQTLDALQVDYDKKKDIAIVVGQVVWTDTVEKLTVVCEYAEHSKKRNFIKASGGKYGRPLMIKVIDGDSLYLSADTLLSSEIVAEDSLEMRDSLALSSGELPDSAAISEVKMPDTDSLPAAVEDTLSDKKVSPLFPLEPEAANTLHPESPEPPNLLSDSTNIENPVEIGAEEEEKPPRLILAYRDVRIFKSNLQAICDSLSYSSLDSLFRLFRQPLIWSDTSQFSADTVNIQLANDKIDRIFLRQNSFIINTPDEVFFNQIKGKNSTAFFENSNLRRVRVSGNAESVYYALDDDRAYMGVNKAICSEMLIEFGDNKVEGIHFYTEPKATLLPMKKADHEQLKMQGFNWQIEKQPRSVEDLLLPKKEMKAAAPPAEVPDGEDEGGF